MVIVVRRITNDARDGIASGWTRGESSKPVAVAVSSGMKIDHPAATDARVEERAAVDAATFAAEVATSSTPIVLRGQVSHWASVRAGLDGDRAIAAYLAGLGNGGQPMEVLIGGPEFGGRFFYRGDQLEGFNFHREKASLGALLNELLRLSALPENARHILYANAATAPEHLPGWSAANPLDMPMGGAVPRLWIGNGTQTATHYDGSTNLACVVAGQRRFTLFPPDQVGNLGMALRLGRDDDGVRRLGKGFVDVAGGQGNRRRAGFAAFRIADELDRTGLAHGIEILVVQRVGSLEQGDPVPVLCQDRAQRAACIACTYH